MSDRHAYLIMAHNQPEQLKKLLHAIDYEYNDIYLHLDSKMQNVDVQAFSDVVLASRLYILEQRMDVKWGDFSQIECELALLEAATKDNHCYYHLMSGVDMPIKSQEHIHSFFRNNAGTEFVQYDSPHISEEVLERISKYHFIIKRRENKSVIEKILDNVILKLQFGVDRTSDSGIVFQKGPNWFSITHELAMYVLSCKAFIYKHFKYSICADEMFLQTIVSNSHFNENVVGNNCSNNYENILYCIDWNRGTPYEFTEEDYDYLKSSDMLFARKFNYEKHPGIVNLILDHITTV